MTTTTKTSKLFRAVRFLPLCAFFLCLAPFMGCGTVKFVQKNPYTGEIWTVYQHLGSDTITYCPPIEGVNCMEAELISGPPPANAPAVTPTAFSH